MRSIDATHLDDELPPVDERLVAPGTCYELHDGVLVAVSPAKDPHGILHSKLAALLEAHAASDMQVAVDMLTRTSRIDDIAPDASVFPRARHPRTGRRQLEQLAFEIVSAQSLSDAGKKAAKLAGRGVRRVFAIDLTRARALEWSAEPGGWSVLDASGFIEDPALAVPLPVEPLVSAARVDGAKVDDALARALLAKRNPVLEKARARDVAESAARGLAEGKRAGLAEGKQAGLAEGKQAGLAEGKQAGLAEGKRAGLAEGAVRGRIDALLAILESRGELDQAARARILAERDPARLERWIVAVASGASLAVVLAEP